MVIHVPTKYCGSVRQVGFLTRLSRTPCEVRRGPADSREHTDEVLAEAGFSAEELSRLRAEGAIA